MPWRNTADDRSCISIKRISGVEIYLVRHTTPDVEAGICYGQADVPLKNTFNTELTGVLQTLPTNIDVIFSSPLSRCSLLAEQIRVKNNARLIFDNRLMEMNFGEWELLPWNSIAPEQLKRWMDNYVDTTVPAGESYQALYNRSIFFLNDLREHRYKSAIVVTHHGVLKSIHAHLHNLSLSTAMSIQFPYGSVTHELIN